MSNRYLLAIVFVLFGTKIGWLSGQEPVPQKEINRLVDKGIETIKGAQNLETGSWAQNNFHYTTFLAWALLEGGVPAKDDCVQKAAKFIRAEAFNKKDTYSLSAAIFFLDKLGDPTDTPLIEALAAQLLGGFHFKSGSWDYECPELTKEEKDKLRNRLEKAAQNAPARNKDTKPQIDPSTKQLIAKLGARANFSGRGDNSNTQFAMMALWVARRHGMPVDEELKRVDWRFRNYPHPQGGWGYEFFHANLKETGGAPAVPAFTCAGLLAMALGNGVKAKPADLSKDPFVKKNLGLLAATLDKFAEKKDIFLAAAAGEAGTKHFYFLWSMERVGVVFNIQKIGKHDWYQWGADMMINHYPNPGQWQGAYWLGDTAFAILFLKKANVAADLTERLNLGSVIEKK